MKITLKVFVVLVAMSFAQLVEAREALLEATMRDIKVTSIAPAVQAQLNKASPDERKSLEAAIHTGNLFIPQLLSGNAYNSDPENKDWEKEVEPLIAPSRGDWADQSLEFMRTKNIQYGRDVDHIMYTARLTCPQVALISIQQDDHTTALLYRTNSVGALVGYRANLYQFSLEGAGETYDVRINLDKNRSLVNEVIPKDTWLTWSYTNPAAFLKEFLGDHSTAAFTTKQHENEMVRAYQIAIQEIEKSAAKFCK